jgi:uncharacterized spore protein YtfJ
MTTDLAQTGVNTVDNGDRQRTTAVAERLLERITRATSAAAVYGAPVGAHGRTIVPVARTYFILGGGGGSGEGGQREDGPERRGSGVGAGGGGVGFTVPAGYIELSPEGTRYVAITANRDRFIGIAAGLLLGIGLARLIGSRQ